MNPNRFITSMFNRRLVILTLLFTAPLLVLVGQLYRLTVVQGDEFRRNAERVLISRNLLPTIRGKILDRYGRILAEDRPSFDVLVDYRVISGAWAVTQAGREARETFGEEWNELSRAERERRIQTQFRGRYDREIERLWGEMARLADLPVSVVKARVAAIEESVEKTAHHVWERWSREGAKEFQTTVTLEDVKRPIREQTLPHVIIRRIDPSSEAAFRRLALAGPFMTKTKPAVSIQSAGVRLYPFDQTVVLLPRNRLPSPLRNAAPMQIQLGRVAPLILGRMRYQVYAEDIKRKPLRNGLGKIVDLSGYIDGDHVGRDGLEAAFEDTLRGSRGIITNHLDTGEEDRQPPEIGRDVQLALDIRLQAKIQGILSPQFGLTVVQPWHGMESQLPLGTALAAAAVVIEISSGEILALVTQTPNEWEEIGVDSPDGSNVLHPAYVNRALGKPYPPGSIVKPLMLNAGVASGLWDLTREVDCNGHFYPNDPDHFRCWIYRPRFGLAVHGPLQAVEAIARSCNLYFYTLADTLKQRHLVEWYRKWGVSDRFNLGLWMRRGLINSPEEIDRSELLMMGIGQGPVAWTPLHAANAYAVLARGGYYFEPTLVLNPRPAVDPEIPPARREDLNLDPRTIDLALQGISEVLHNQQYGGARRMDVDPDPEVRAYEPIFNIPGLKTWGKTGTAQHRPWPTKLFAMDENGQIRRDRNGKPILINRASGTGAHSWFVGLVGADPLPGVDDKIAEKAPATPDSNAVRPRYVIVVFVEWGGSGSRCAGPIANQIMQALKDEGYLD